MFLRSEKASREITNPVSNFRGQGISTSGHVALMYSVEVPVSTRRRTMREFVDQDTRVEHGRVHRDDPALRSEPTNGVRERPDEPESSRVRGFVATLDDLDGH